MHLITFIPDVEHPISNQLIKFKKARNNLNDHFNCFGLRQEKKDELTKIYRAEYAESLRQFRELAPEFNELEVRIVRYYDLCFEVKVPCI